MIDIIHSAAPDPLPSFVAHSFLSINGPPSPACSQSGRGGLFLPSTPVFQSQSSTVALKTPRRSSRLITPKPVTELTSRDAVHGRCSFHKTLLALCVETAISLPNRPNRKRRKADAAHPSHSSNSHRLDQPPHRAPVASLQILPESHVRLRLDGCQCPAHLSPTWKGALQSATRLVITKPVHSQK